MDNGGNGWDTDWLASSDTNGAEPGPELPIEVIFQVTLGGADYIGADFKQRTCSYSGWARRGG